LVIPSNSIIYCDKPYEGVLGYAYPFDHKSFWVWCRERAKEGHRVYVSEYNAPEDFECVREINHQTTINKKGENYDHRLEKLFTYYV